MLTAAELHDWADQEGLYVPLTPRGTDYLRSLLETWVRHHRLDMKVCVNVQSEN